MRYVGEEPEAGQAKYLGGLRKSKHGKRDTRGQRGVSRGCPKCLLGHALCPVGAVCPVFSLIFISLSWVRVPVPCVCRGVGGCCRGGTVGLGPCVHDGSCWSQHECVSWSVVISKCAAQPARVQDEQPRTGLWVSLRVKHAEGSAPKGPGVQT